MFRLFVPDGRLGRGLAEYCIGVQRTSYPLLELSTGDTHDWLVE